MNDSFPSQCQHCDAITDDLDVAGFCVDCRDETPAPIVCNEPITARTECGGTIVAREQELLKCEHGHWTRRPTR